MREKRRAMLSLEKCREILEVGEEVSNEEIEGFQVVMRGLVNLMYDEELKEATL